MSLLTSYTIEGYISAVTFPSTYDSELFSSFIIDKLLPHYNAYPEPQSVLIIDNASIHHKYIELIETACNLKGVYVLLLPLYSLDFNLIEENFSDLKVFIHH